MDFQIVACRKSIKMDAQQSKKPNEYLYHLCRRADFFVIFMIGEEWFSIDENFPFSIVNKLYLELGAALY